MSTSPDFQFKILTLGDSGVGKTSIILRYTENTFSKNSQLSSLGVDYKTKIINTDNKSCKLCIWDTAGQEKFNHLTKQYYKECDGALLIFDLTNKKSYDKINYWLNDLKNSVNIDNLGIILIGNKVDEIETREITKDEGEKLASKLGVLYYEVSALTKDHIDKSFKWLVTDILRKKKISKNIKNDGKKKKITLSEENNDDHEQTSKCC